MSPFLSNLKSRCARLAFWRGKATETASGADDDRPYADRHTGAEEPIGDADVAPSRPRLLARITQWLRRRRAASDAATDVERDATTVVVASEAALPADDTDRDEPAPAPGRLKRLLARLRSKWVWLPLTAGAALSAIGAVSFLLVSASQEQERLRQELAAARLELEQSKATAAPTPAAPVPPAAVEVPPAKPIDPAFAIVGQATVGASEAGLNAADCVVSDREQVAQDLKRCIERFNAATTHGATRRSAP